MMKYFADVEVFIATLYLQTCAKTNSHVHQNICRIRYLCSGLKISNQISRSRNKIIFAATPTFFFFVTFFLKSKGMYHCMRIIFLFESRSIDNGSFVIHLYKESVTMSVDISETCPQTQNVATLKHQKFNYFSSLYND